VVASSLDTLEPVLLEGFESKEDLVACLKASANVPRIAGEPLQHRWAPFKPNKPSERTDNTVECFYGEELEVEAWAHPKLGPSIPMASCRCVKSASCNTPA